MITLLQHTLRSFFKNLSLTMVFAKVDLFSSAKQNEVKHHWVGEIEVVSHEPCTRQSALIVAKSVKFHSNQQQDVPCIVESVGKNGDRQEGNIEDSDSYCK